MNVDNDYIYSGVPITPQIVAHLTKELFGGKLVQRQMIVEQVLAMHVKRGGLPPNVSDFSGSVKKALALMKEAGEAENPSSGYWKILPTDTDVTATGAEGADLIVSPQPEVAAHPPDDSVAEMVFGTGSGSVYLYYLPTYRARAEERQEKSWPCKIGRTEQNPLHRILAQAATALPEKPTVALILRTTYASALEAALHGVLTLRGLAIEDAPGAEWFLTSPTEVVDLAKVFDPHLYDSIPSESEPKA